MKFNGVILISMLACLLLFSCESKNDSYSEDIAISGVTKIKLTGIFNVNITQRDQESLVITGNEDLVKNLQFVQNGDLLELTIDEKFGGGFFQKDGLQVDLAIADLQELEFEGTGNIRSTHRLELNELTLLGSGVGNISLDLDAQFVDAQLNFVGNMTLEGQTEELYLVNEGIGNIDASKFTAQKVNLVSSGIGSVSVHCVDELALEVNGIGSVSYTGNPTILNEKVAGIGKVNRN